MSDNRKIVHAIKGKLSIPFGLAQMVEGGDIDKEEWRKLMLETASHTVKCIPEIVELLDKIE